MPYQPQPTQYQPLHGYTVNDNITHLFTDMREVTNGVDRWEPTIGETTLVLLKDIHKMLLTQQTQGGFSCQDQSITNLRSEIIIEEIILPEESDPREEVPRVDDDKDEVK